jgi:hypothetical protein
MRFGLRCIFKIHAFPFILLLCSCNKEVEQPFVPDREITGEWIFMSNTVSTETITTYTVDSIVYKNKLTADYITYNNNGNVTITEGSIKGTDLRFDVITTAYFSFYVGDDNEEDSVEEPFSNYMDSAYGCQKIFQRIGEDSVYFPNGIIMQLPDIGGDETTSMDLPQGGSIKRFDNSLLITTTSMRDSSYEEDGMVYYITKTEKVDMAFERQR